MTFTDWLRWAQSPEHDPTKPGETPQQARERRRANRRTAEYLRQHKRDLEAEQERQRMIARARYNAAVVPARADVARVLERYRMPRTERGYVNVYGDRMEAYHHIVH